MGLLKNLGAKAMELMEEDTVYSALQKRDDSCYELLLKASDENYLAYVSAYLRLLKKGKHAGNFEEAMSQTMLDRSKEFQKRVWDIINGYEKHKGTENNHSNNVSGGDDVLEQLEELISLKENGIITEEEFNQKEAVLWEKI